MLFLILSIAAMSAFMLTLKFFAARNINASQAIIVNYALATAIGVLSCKEGVSPGRLLEGGWWYLAVVAGVLMFASMHLMAVSTKFAGVAVTTISSRTSLLVPIIFSAIFFGERITPWQAVGTGLVIASFIIIFYNRADRSTLAKGSALKAVLMPVGVFLTVGIISVCMKSAQQIISLTGDYDADYPVYQAISFASALICAIAYYAVTEGRKAFAFSWKSILGGVCLGAFNYITVSSILLSLRTIPTSTFYAAYNMGVVVVTSVTGWLAFGEKLSPRKITGIILAIMAIAVLMLFS
jgi:drug/metabolite transporter (DMT)-like permease